MLWRSSARLCAHGQPFSPAARDAGSQFEPLAYRGYAGYGAPLAWVCTEPLSLLCGGRNDAERRAALRQHTEQPVRQGAVECPWERLVAGLVLGTETFARSLKLGLQIKEREQRQARNLVRPVAWEEIILALERALGERGITKVPES